MNTASTLISDQRRAAERRQHALFWILSAGILLAAFLIAGNVDHSETIKREQRVADIACRNAFIVAAKTATEVSNARYVGAQRVEAGDSFIFICDVPMDMEPIRRALLMREPS